MEATFATGHYEVDDAATEEFWEPPDEMENLYDQLWRRKYCEILQTSIVWVRTWLTQVHNYTHAVCVMRTTVCIWIYIHLN